jgi:hypothetical protein
MELVINQWLFFNNLVLLQCVRTSFWKKKECCEIILSVRVRLLQRVRVRVLQWVCVRVLQRVRVRLLQRVRVRLLQRVRVRVLQWVRVRLLQRVQRDNGTECGVFVIICMILRLKNFSTQIFEDVTLELVKECRTVFYQFAKTFDRE